MWSSFKRAQVRYVISQAWRPQIWWLWNRSSPKCLMYALSCFQFLAVWLPHFSNAELSFSAIGFPRTSILVRKFIALDIFATIAEIVWRTVPLRTVSTHFITMFMMPRSIPFNAVNHMPRLIDFCRIVARDCLYTVFCRPFVCLSSRSETSWMYPFFSADSAPLSSLRTFRECIGTNKVPQKLLFSDINGYGFCIELGSLGCLPNYEHELDSEYFD